MIEIRIATIEDAAALCEIYAPYVRDTAITFEYEVPSAEEFAKRMENTLKKYPYIIAKQDDLIVGYAYASAFKGRAAYDWAVETSVYVKQDCKRMGIGKFLYQELEKYLGKQGIINVNACIAYPEVEDEYLTKNSVCFHEKMGYRMVGEFRKCAYKFDRWYNMVWMEKYIGEHLVPVKPVIWFSELEL